MNCFYSWREVISRLFCLWFDDQSPNDISCHNSTAQNENSSRNKRNDGVPTEVKEILLQSCLDKWAFWLDEHSIYVRNLTGEQDKRNLYNLLDEFISRLKNLDTGYSEKWLSSYDGTPTVIIEHDSTSW